MTMTIGSIRPRTAQTNTLILLTMSIGVLIAQIDTSVVNLAVKEIGTSLNAGVTALQWVVDAYNLVYASLLLTAGTLADLYGRRRIFALGIALFTLGTASGLVNTARMVGATLGVAVLGAILPWSRAAAPMPAISPPACRLRSSSAALVKCSAPLRRSSSYAAARCNAEGAPA